MFQYHKSLQLTVTLVKMADFYGKLVRGSRGFGLAGEKPSVLPSSVWTNLGNLWSNGKPAEKKITSVNNRWQSFCHINLVILMLIN